MNISSLSAAVHRIRVKARGLRQKMLRLTLSGCEAPALDPQSVLVLKPDDIEAILVNFAYLLSIAPQTNKTDHPDEDWAIEKTMQWLASRECFERSKMSNDEWEKHLHHAVSYKDWYIDPDPELILEKKCRPIPSGRSRGFSLPGSEA